MTAGTAPGRAAGPARAIFFGSGAFAVPILDAVAEHTALVVVAVVTAPDRPVGRSQALTPTPVAVRARERGLEVLQPAGVRSPEVIAGLAALQPDLGILADYGRIIPPALLEVPPRGILGVHPSLLPRHRGATPIQATILAGDPAAGVTVYRMDRGMDTGPILATDAWPIDAATTAPALESVAAVRGARLLADVLPAYLDGSVRLEPQPAEGASVTARLTRADARLDPSRPAHELERQVRAHAGWPGSFVETATGRLAVVAVRVDPAGPGDVIGTIVEAEQHVPAIVTAEGRLALLRVQPAGGREMAGADFLRGHRDLLGTSLVGAATVSER